MFRLHFEIRTAPGFFLFSTNYTNYTNDIIGGGATCCRCRDGIALRDGSRPLVAIDITRITRQEGPRVNTNAHELRDI